MPLRLVPPSPPGPVEQLRQRLRQHAREDGHLQCNRCGCRVAVTVLAGAKLHRGRVSGGTMLARYACAECWKRGVHVDMRPELKKIE